MTAGRNNFNDFAENQLTCVPEIVLSKKSKGQDTIFDLAGKFLGVISPPDLTVPAPCHRSPELKTRSIAHKVRENTDPKQLTKNITV